MKAILVVAILLIGASSAHAYDYHHHVEAVQTLNPRLTYEEAQVHVEAARLASEEYGYEIEFLLGQASTESAFRPNSLSYMLCLPDQPCKRKLTHWRGKYRPPHARGPWYCGAVQVGGRVPWSKCRELMDDIALNYMTGAAHLQEWETRYIQKDPKCRQYKVGTRPARTCALWGYVGGFKGLKSKRNKYPANIYRKERRILRYVAEAKAQEEKERLWTKDTKIERETWKPWSAHGRSLVAVFDPSDGLFSSVPIPYLQ